MLILVSEAWKRLCPQTMSVTDDLRGCYGEACAAWRYADRTAPAVGYCGMAPIKPEITPEAIAQARGQG